MLKKLTAPIGCLRFPAATESLQMKCLILTLAVVAVDAKAVENPSKQMQQFSGTWQLVSAIKDGKPTPQDVVSKIRVVMKDGRHTVYFKDQIVAKQIPFTIDPAHNPKMTTDTLPDGRQIKGIYKLDGDTLTSCVAEPGRDRPTEFQAQAGSGRTLRVFKRVKP